MPLMFASNYWLDVSESNIDKISLAKSLFSSLLRILLFSIRFISHYIILVLSHINLSILTELFIKGKISVNFSIDYKQIKTIFFSSFLFSSNRSRSATIFSINPFFINLIYKKFNYLIYISYVI